MKNTNKRLNVFLMTTLLFLFASVFANSEGYDMNLISQGVCGENIEWSLFVMDENDSYVLQIDGTGRMNNWSDRISPWEEYKNRIKTILINEGIISISDYAFYNCTNLISVSLPETLISIGENAFNNCSNLQDIIIPDGVLEIGDYGFYRCKSLRSIVLPDNITSLNYRVLSACSSLQNIILPEGITKLDGYCFSGCSSLNSITLPNSLTIIDECAFSFSGITSINISKNVTTLEPQAFEDARQLRSIIIDPNNSNYSSEDGVLFSKDKTILYLYPEAKTNTTYIVPGSVKEIGKSAFDGNHYLRNLTLPDELESIGSRAFDSCCFDSLVLPSSIRTINNGAFVNSSIPTLTIPGGVETIEESLCDCCTIKTIILEEGIKYIKSMAFAASNASNPSIILPSSIKMIAGDAIDQRYHICCHHGSYAEDWALTKDRQTSYICLFETTAYPADDTGDGYVHTACEICKYQSQPDVSIHKNMIIKVPASLEIIQSEAFSDISAEQIVLPPSLTIIKNGVFSNNMTLKLVVILGNQTDIEPDAFNGSPNVTLLCGKDSKAMQYAIQNNISYAYFE